MKALPINSATVAFCFFCCCPLLSTAAPQGYIVGWGENGVGAVTGTATVNPPNMSNSSTGMVAITSHVVSNAMAVAAGGVHGLALTIDGSVVAWGGVVLGDGTAPSYPTNGYVKINGRILTGVTAIAGSRSVDLQCFDLALRGDGRVVAWGGNQFSQTAVPASLSNVMAISAGAYQGLALRNDGTIAGWGLGNPPPSELSNVVAIAAGGQSGRNLALKRDGTVIDWPVLSADYSPTAPPGLSNVVAIAAGIGHSLALKRDGTIVGWGSNQYGESTGTPNPTFPHESTGTVMVAGQILGDVVKIAAGHQYSMALKRNGTVIVWGHPFAMRLVPPEGLSNVVAIAAGENFCLAITTNSAVAERFRH